MNQDRGLVVERHIAEWLRAQAIVPGVELHDDPDITWVVHPGRAWSNAGVMIRLVRRTAASRLDTLVNRYRSHRRGMGLWVSPAATPDMLPDLLKSPRPPLSQALSRDAARSVEWNCASAGAP